MPKISKDTAPDVEDFGPPRTPAAKSTTTPSTSSPSGRLTPSPGCSRVCPGEACPCPHWGYLFAGKITVTYADRDEVYEAGDAFYMSPGHVPAAEAGSEFVQFSPREALADVRAVMMLNANEMQTPDLRRV